MGGKWVDGGYVFLLHMICHPGLAPKVTAISLEYYGTGAMCACVRR